MGRASSWGTAAAVSADSGALILGVYALYRADMYHFCSEIVLVLVVHILFLTVACDKVMAFGHELEILVKLQAWKGCATHVRGLAQGPYGCVAERSFASFLMIDAV
jgi:hypothetical protein